MFHSALDPQLSIVSVSEVSAQALFDFREQSYQESIYVEKLTRAEAEDLIKQCASMYLLLRGSTIVGQLEVDVRPNEIHIDMISVLKQEQGRHGAAMLLRHATDLAKKMLKPQTTLIVDQRNTRAVKFYKRHGFVLVENIKGTLHHYLYAKPVAYSSRSARGDKQSSSIKT